MLKEDRSNINDVVQLCESMIDTHAHIYLPEFQEDREKTVNAARQTGIDTILMPAIDSNTHETMLEVEKNFTECISMMGLHPCSVNEDFEKELDIVRRHFETRNFIAIGEIGLDFYWDVAFKEQQYEAFHKQIEIATRKNLPIVIHSRNAIDECIDVVEHFKKLTGVFHCFSGDLRQAQKIIDLGFMLGIGGVVTFKNAGLDKVIAEVGLSNIILETDAPYLAPVPFRGKRNEPAYLKFVAERISGIINKSVEEIEKLTSSNARRLFGLK